MSQPINWNDLIATASNNTGVPPSWISTLLGLESSNGTNTLSPTGVQGAAQITKGTWKTLYPTGSPVYSTDPAAQVTAMSLLLEDYRAQPYGHNPALVAVAYNAGPGAAQYAWDYLQKNPGASEATAISQAISYYAAKGEYPTGVVNKTAETLKEAGAFTTKVGGDGSALTAAAGAATSTSKQTSYGVDDNNAMTALAIQGSLIGQDQVQTVLNAISPPMVIQDGLGESPWFADANLIQANGATQALGFPITFQVFFSPNRTNPLAQTNKAPISIRLNASLQKHDRTMTHTTNKRMTRTGILVTLWDMHPDSISGSGSTGVFMNQLGLTDFLSYAQSDSPEVAQMLRAGRVTPPDVLIQNEGLRVAAKDAFVEFLSLFRNNGVVWHYNNAYDGTLDSLNQTGPNAFSPVTGSSTFQSSARNNDVLSRGSVVMKFRNSIYGGYFKTLSWNMDAESPFRWNFNFVFQVERTLTAVPIPNTGSN